MFILKNGLRKSIYLPAYAAHKYLYKINKIIISIQLKLYLCARYADLDFC